MLRQLARLTSPIPAAGPGALAVAVYADEGDHAVAARESGYEGVACVDDAARLLDVLCGIHLRSPQPWTERWARGLLEFVLWMQEPDGRWVNFVRSWSGARNDDGITSRVGENFWHARAIVSLSHARIALDDDRAERALERGLQHAIDKPAAPDVRALHAVTAIRLLASADVPAVRSALSRWCDELVACRNAAGVLKNSPYERDAPHLWAHLQEGVLADASRVLGEDRYVLAAERSAELLLVPAVQDGFPHGRSPYDVASCVYDFDRLFASTGDSKWQALASDARAWFDGRNPAGKPVYDRLRGRVADGIDGDRVSENSGAESNIVAAEALFEDAVQMTARLDDPLAAAGLTG